jgi:large subunit ribosomal protein L15
MAGMHKHKWSYTVKYAPDHFGHNEFRPPKRTVTERWVNLGDLPAIIAAQSSGDEKQILDLTALGYDKLLGQGSVSAVYTVKVPRASESAIEKIRAAGGTVEVEPKKETSTGTKESNSSSGKTSKAESKKQVRATDKSSA